VLFSRLIYYYLIFIIVVADFYKFRKRISIEGEYYYGRRWKERSLPQGWKKQSAHHPTTIDGLFVDSIDKSF
jgi:hypothetical protein